MTVLQNNAQKNIRFDCKCKMLVTFVLRDGHLAIKSDAIGLGISNLFFTHVRWDRGGGGVRIDWRLDTPIIKFID